MSTSVSSLHVLILALLRRCEEGRFVYPVAFENPLQNGRQQQVADRHQTSEGKKRKYRLRPLHTVQTLPHQNEHQIASQVRDPKVEGIGGNRDVIYTGCRVREEVAVTLYLLLPS
jgi:hypothetical protein